MILFFDAVRQWKEIGLSALSAIDRTGQAGKWILGDEVAAFEKNLGALLNLPRVISCASGLDALDMALRASGLTANDKVLTTPLSAFATTLAILRVGAIPVFIDVDETGLVDLGLAKQILEANPDIRFFVPVHLFGFPLNLPELDALIKMTGVTVIEDCAQSIGAVFDGLSCGSIGIAGAFSFYPTKNIGALGDGGAVATGDPRLAEAVFRMRDYGQSEKYSHVDYGFNSRLDELQASLLNKAILPRTKSWGARRKEIAEEYRAKITNPKLRQVKIAREAEPIWHIFPILVEKDRADFERHLTSQAIPYSRHYPRLITDQPFLLKCKHEIKTPLTSAEKMANGEISLPIHPWLPKDEVDAIIQACNAWKN